MTVPEIEKLAETVRQEHKLRVPVDLGKLCAEEGIELAPGDYPGKFHGRIEFLSDEGVFAIFHPAQTSISEGRMRYTIAHELGHYFIEEHRDLIIAGNVHNSVESFAPVRNRIEQEADTFAASLLMPDKKIAELAGSKGYLDARGVRRLAEDCRVGLRAAAFRYSELADEPCWLIFRERWAYRVRLPIRRGQQPRFWRAWDERNSLRFGCAPLHLMGTICK